MFRLALILALAIALASAGDASASACNLNAGGTVAWTCAAGDDVTISGGTTVTVAANSAAKTLMISGGSILFSNAATLTVGGDVSVNPNGGLLGAGTLAVSGTFDKQGAGTFTVADASRLQLNGAQSNLTSGDICLINNTGNDPLVQIFGAFHIAETASATPFSCGNNVAHHAIEIGFGGSLVDDKSGTISFAVGLRNSAGTISLAAGQEIDLAGRFDQSKPGETTIAAGATLGGLGPKGVDGGLMVVDGTVAAGNNLELTGGILRGSGHVTGYVKNISGAIEPGDGIGSLEFDNFTQGPAGTLRLDLGGKTSPGGDFDQLVVDYTAALGGKVEVTLQNGFTPQLGDTFQFTPPPAVELLGNYASATGAPAGLAFRTVPSVFGVRLETTLPPPQNTSPPTISGTPEVGQTLVCNPGTWNAGPTFTFQWLRNGNPVAGATQAQYPVTEDDVGLLLACHVTATNDGGTSEAETDPVRAQEPAPPAAGETPAPTPSTPGTKKTPTPPKKRKLGKRSVCSKLRGQKICLNGPAALRSPACLKIRKAKYKFTVTASRKKVKVVSVRFLLDRKTAANRKKKPYAATLNGAKLKKGRHRVIADGRYVIKKKKLRKKLTLSWKTC